MALLRHSTSLRSLVGAVAILAAACQSPTDAPLRSLAAGRPQFATIPPQGTASTLDIGNWNVEWFGDTGNGPTNEALQQQNVHDVMAGVDMDIRGPRGSRERKRISAATPLSSGSRSVATLVYAKVILTSQNTNFAGRPPVEFKLHLTDANEDVIFIVMHCKAGSTTDAWQLRNAASPALESYLDTPTRRRRSLSSGIGTTMSIPRSRPGIRHPISIL